MDRLSVIPCSCFTYLRHDELDAMLLGAKSSTRYAPWIERPCCNVPMSVVNIDVFVPTDRVSAGKAVCSPKNLVPSSASRVELVFFNTDDRTSGQDRTYFLWRLFCLSRLLAWYEGPRIGAFETVEL